MDFFAPFGVWGAARISSKVMIGRAWKAAPTWLSVSWWMKWMEAFDHSLLSLSAALVATRVMQVTTHQAGFDSPSARLALAQRIALAALAIFLMLNAVTPFITPDPPWLANLPLVVAIMAFLLAFGLLHMRRAGSRCQSCKSQKQEKATQRASGAHEPWLISLPVPPICRAR